MELHPDQQTFKQNLRDAFRTSRSVLGVAPTGFGKTVVTASILSDATGVTWFVVHRRELVQQSMIALRAFGLDPGMICAGEPYEPHKRVFVVMAQTASRRLKTLPAPDFIVFDEAHHVVGNNTWGRIVSQYPSVPILGLTATPERLDGRGLGDHFDRLVEGPPVDWLIKKGRLSDYIIYAPSTVSCEGVHIRSGEFAPSEVEAALEEGHIVGDAIKSYQQFGHHRPGIIFCPTVSFSKATTAQFNAQGIRAAHLDGNTPTTERDNTLEDYRNGQLDLISNVGLFGEGFDVPKAKVLIDLAPTASLGRAMQRWGRVLRIVAGDSRPACLLDHAGNIMRHGLPDDPRQWSLDAPKRKRRTNEATTAIRQCSNCYAIHRPAPRCPYCGFLHRPNEREIREVDGELVLLDKDAIRKAQKKKRQEQAACRTLDELIALGHKRGYKNPRFWATKVFHNRHARR